MRGVHGGWRDKSSSSVERRLLGIVAIAISALAIAPALATPVTTQFVRTAPQFFGGLAFDSSTGNVYELPGYGPSAPATRSPSTRRSRNSRPERQAVA